MDSVDIHYTAGPVSSSVQNIAAYQVGPTAQLPFPAIAYHLFVEGDGTVYLVNSLDIRVWHNDGPQRNERAIGICYSGDYAPNTAQKAGIKNAIRWAQTRLGRQLMVAGHKDNSATQCPGPKWPTWRSEVLP